MTMPSAVHTTIASTTETGFGKPRYCMAQKETYAPTMMTSPWAKFSILAMP